MRILLALSLAFLITPLAVSAQSAGLTVTQAEYQSLCTIGMDYFDVFGTIDVSRFLAKNSTGAIDHTEVGDTAWFVWRGSSGRDTVFATFIDKRLAEATHNRLPPAPECSPAVQAEADASDARAAAAAAAAEEAYARAVEKSSCRTDLQCWAEDHHLTATIRCQRTIEGMAVYDYEWTDGLLEAKFDRYRWFDIGVGVVTYLGSELQFMDGLGRWIPIRYECDYNPDTDTVLDVRLS